MCDWSCYEWIKPIITSEYKYSLPIVYLTRWLGITQIHYKWWYYLTLINTNSLFIYIITTIPIIIHFSQMVVPIIIWSVSIPYIIKYFFNWSFFEVYHSAFSRVVLGCIHRMNTRCLHFCLFIVLFCIQCQLW